MNKKSYVYVMYWYFDIPKSYIFGQILKRYLIDSTL